MIVLDTHVWVWWIDRNPRLTNEHEEIIRRHLPDGLGVSVFSCWEIAKNVEYGRMTFDAPLTEWIEDALSSPGIRLLPLTPGIAVEATRLPGAFHKDPADQIIVATARVMDRPLVTYDTKILGYPYVKLLP